ncbi:MULTISPECIES: nuclear transport factor 2 family protein [unclassified Bradyrhizobium]|uniref:nuclear transport factor 2 family protein n=1 Tax=unclassified Bradyrhizobium TaxID=2631580 RepID=UPI00291668A5|nr:MULTISPECIES: nuclear transport factor 2 family protein [unclassified Bradyrhizobium]
MSSPLPYLRADSDVIFEREFKVPKPTAAILKDPITAQLDAYNSHDLGRFLSCFAPEVVFKDGAGELMLKGHRQMYRVYSGLFEAGKIKASVDKIGKVGNHEVHHQVVTGLSKKPQEVIIVYRHEDGLIREVQMFR